MSYHDSSLTWYSNNQHHQNQGKRNLQPQGNQALSLPPSQLSIPPGITIPPSYSNPYQHSPYSTNPSPFAFPTHSALSHQNPYGQQHSLSQNPNQHVPQSPSLHNPRKRSVTDLDSASTLSSNYPIDHHGLFSPTDSAKGIHNSYGMPGPSSAAGPSVNEGLLQGGEPSSVPKPKKGRTNTPWTPAEEHRLKVMRDAGNSWSEIAKTFPTRTEGSVKKHWYKVCGLSMALPLVLLALTRIFMLTDDVPLRICTMRSLRKTRSAISFASPHRGDVTKTNSLAECRTACRNQRI